MPSNLTFTQLRVASDNRHKTSDALRLSLHWTPTDWFEAMVGEVGEFANKHKKFKRGDYHKQGGGTERFIAEAAEELADVAIYLDSLAREMNIDLGEAIIAKFNKDSERFGSKVRL